MSTLYYSVSHKIVYHGYHHSYRSYVMQCCFLDFVGPMRGGVTL